jgi:SagB-type dehydrogenase family enzyme
VNIKLPQHTLETSISLEAALSQRETKREYLDDPLSLSNLSQLLFAAQGMRGSGSKLHAPSAQEQYPLSVFIVVSRVADIAAGVYKYDNSDHFITELKKGYISGSLECLAIGEQPWVGNAAAIIVLAANIQSMNKHFAEQPPLNRRGERYCYIEVGAVAQNVQLVGTALNTGMVLVGGFDNEGVKQLLNLPPELEPSALLCLGNV